jgi:hypothetical protein
MSPFNINQPQSAPRPVLNANHRRVLNALRDGGALNGNTLNVAIARQILIANVDQFVGAGGNSNNVLDGDEITFLRDLINVNAGDEFVPLQQALSNSGRQLGIVTTTAATNEGAVNDAVRADAPDLNRLAGGRLGGGAQTVRQIENGMQRWRIRNAGNTFSLPSGGLARAAQRALQSSGLADNDPRLQGLEGNKRDLRRLLYAFWNNDRRGIKFLSIQEIGAIRQWAMTAYGAGNMAQFQQDFNELFAKSVQEDTPFSMDLMARQWAQASGSSAFLGQRGSEFRSFFDNFGQSIGSAVIAERGLRPGDIIAAYNGQSEHPGFDNVILRVGDDGRTVEIQRSISPHGDTRKIGYLFEEGEGSVDVLHGGAFGAGGEPGAGNPLTRLHGELTEANIEGLNDSLQALSAFSDTNIGAMSIDQLRGLESLLVDLNNNPRIPAPIKGNIRRVQATVQARIRALSTTSSSTEPSTSRAAEIAEAQRVLDRLPVGARRLFPGRQIYTSNYGFMSDANTGSLYYQTPGARYWRAFDPTDNGLYQASGVSGSATVTPVPLPGARRVPGVAGINPPRRTVGDDYSPTAVGATTITTDPLLTREVNADSNLYIRIPNQYGETVAGRTGSVVSVGIDASGRIRLGNVTSMNTSRGDFPQRYQNSESALQLLEAAGIRVTPVFSGGVWSIKVDFFRPGAAGNEFSIQYRNEPGRHLEEPLRVRE